PEPVRPAVPALALAAVAIIVLTMLWPIVKPSFQNKQHLAGDSQPSKIVLQDGLEREYKGDMEIINRADSNFIELQNPELMTKLRQSMKISLTANGDSLIFSWLKITDIKSYQLALVYESQTVSITPEQGVQNHSFSYPKNKVDDAAKIQSWELTVEAVNGTHYKIQKIFKINQ
ncbi:MAG: hypothetical protein SCK70_09415, partial [bacterium]|nr:hypothetical protein [bacterium]